MATEFLAALRAHALYPELTAAARGGTIADGLSMLRKHDPVFLRQVHLSVFLALPLPLPLPLAVAVAVSLAVAVALPLCLSASLPLCLSASLPLCRSDSLSICLSVSLSLCLSVSLSDRCRRGARSSWRSCTPFYPSSDGKVWRASSVCRCGPQ